MRASLYRVANLSIDARPDGYGWRCWIIVRGNAKPVDGQVTKIGDLEAALKGRVANHYLLVTGEVLPDSAL
jgi:hypothetical protein